MVTRNESCDKTLIRNPARRNCALSLAKGVCVALLACTACGVGHAADTAVAVRVGSLGIGGDVDFKLEDYLSARIGYSGYDFSYTIAQTDVTYDAKLKLSNPHAILDWYTFGGGFRLSLGAVGSGTKIQAVGRPTGNGSFTLNGTTYTASEISSLSGEFKGGNSLSPYVGLGWGNAVRAGHHLSVLFDLGAYYSGKPKIALTAICSPSAPAGLCQQLNTDVAAEQRKLQDKLKLLEWYPVISLGVAYRF